MIVWNVGQTFSNTREIPARLSQASPLQLISVLQNGEWVSEESGCSGGRRAEHSLSVLFKCFADLKVASAWHLVEKCLWRERGNRNIFPKSNILEGKKKKRGTLFKQLLNTFPIFSSWLGGSVCVVWRSPDVCVRLYTSASSAPGCSYLSSLAVSVKPIQRQNLNLGV